MAAQIGLASPRKRVPLALHLVVLLLAANIMITQVIASQLGHHPALGRPVLGPFYYPWMWAVWSFQYYHDEGSLFTRAYLTAALVTVGAFGLYALMLALTRRSQGHAHLHGSAHFASSEEIRRTGLLPRRGEPGRGVYVGGWKDRRRAVHYLRHDGPEHVIAVASTRSGKGGLVSVN
jgi:type IV secretion system protein VirD4